MPTTIEVLLKERVVFKIFPEAELPDNAIVTPGHSQLFMLEEGQTVDLNDTVVVWENIAIPSNVAFCRALKRLDEFLEEDQLPKQKPYIDKMKKNGGISEYEGFRKSLNINLAAFDIAVHCQDIYMQEDKATRTTQHEQSPTSSDGWTLIMRRPSANRT